jgi:2-polyprenyl-6-methoxyphenol hydroxylase-like FAD-dependent oxidoreductase
MHAVSNLWHVSNTTQTKLCWPAAGVDVGGHTVSFEASDGSPVCEQYDLLVGADGVGSAVRAALQQHYPDMSVVVTDSGREYKTYTGLKGDIEPEGGPGPSDAVHGMAWHGRQM